MALLLYPSLSIWALWLAVVPVGIWSGAQPVGEADRPHLHDAHPASSYDATVA